MTRQALRATSREMSTLRTNRVPSTLPALLSGNATGVSSSSGSSRNRALLGYQSQGNYSSGQSYNPGSTNAATAEAMAVAVMAIIGTSCWDDLLGLIAGL